jgi:TonB family protein
MVRIEDERLPEERQKGSKSDRRLDKIVVYDLAGRMTEQIEFGSSEGCTRTRRTYSYNEGGDRREAIYFGEALGGDAPNGAQEKVLICRQSFKYDAEGRWIEVNDYDAAGNPDSKTVYKYDEKGRVTERSERYRNSAESCTLKYNTQGLVAAEICRRSAPGPAETTYAYEIDAQGNWIKRVASFSTTIGGKRVNQGGRITHREIKYHSTGSSSSTASEKDAIAFDASRVIACPPLVIRRSGGAFQESATRRVIPDYPHEAREKRISGSVLVELTTDEKGKVTSVKTISGPAELRRAAEEAAKRWEFTPTLLSKVPVRVIGTITFNFNL